MRKSFVAWFVVALLIAGGIALHMSHPGWWRRLSNRHLELAGHSVKAIMLEPTWPAIPDAFLQINGRREAIVFQGAPLILSVRLANQRAMNADLQNKANEAHQKEVQTTSARGNVPKEKTELALASFAKPLKIPSVTLGGEQTGWEQYLHFVLQEDARNSKALSWPLKLITVPPQKTLVLDQKNTAQLDYALAPESAAGLGLGQYYIVAVVEVPGDSNLAADRWRGRVESGPVELTIKERPARMSREEEENASLNLAHFYLATGEFKHALEDARKVVALNPNSIPGYILVGRAQEKLGDPRAALAAMDKALHEFYRQHPHPDEPPAYLIRKSMELRKKLGGQP